MNDTFQLSWTPEVADYAEAFAARNRARRTWLKIAVLALLGAIFAVVEFTLGQLGPALETDRVFVLQLPGRRFLLLAKRGLAEPAALAALRRALTVGRTAGHAGRG